MRLLTGLLLAVSLSVFAGMAGAASMEEDGSYAHAMRLIVEGRYDEAREALRRLAAEEPEHAGAWLDLAILQCGLGNAEEAENLFEAIEARFAPPPAIRQLIAQHRAQGCQRAVPNGLARVRVGRGQDSNVNQGARNPNFSIGSGGSAINLVLSPEFSPKADSFTALSAEWMGSMSSTGTRYGAQFFSRQYDTLSNFDLGLASFNAEHPWKLGNWDARTSGQVNVTMLGHHMYQQQWQAAVHFAPPLRLPAGWRLETSGSWTMVKYPTLDGFDSNLLEIRGMLEYKLDDLLVQGNAGYGQDRGAANRIGGDRRSLFANLAGRFRIYGNIYGELAWMFQDWSGNRPYAPGLIDVPRHQKTDMVRAALFFPVVDGHGVYVEYRDVRNRENIPIFEYRGHTLQLSWQWQGLF